MHINGGLTPDLVIHESNDTLFRKIEENIYSRKRSFENTEDILQLDCVLEIFLAW